MGMKECGAGQRIQMMQQTVVRNEAQHSGSATALPLALVGLLLHHGRRNRRWRGGQAHAGVGVHYRDSIARA